ncbi:MAG: FliH/SctL family protein [Halochromatium sp.]
MAILRSRSVEGKSCPVPNPAVARSLREWQRRIDEAHVHGEQAAGLAMAERANELERREAALEATLAERERAAEAACRERVDGALRALGAALEVVPTLQQEVVRAAEREVVELALAIAARLLRHEIEHDPTWMEAALGDALARVPDRRRVELRLHPRDAAAVREHLPETGSLAGIDELDIVADPAAARGAMVLRSGGTVIDAGAPGAWHRLAEDLLATAPAPTAEIGDPPGTQAEQTAAEGEG